MTEEIEAAQVEDVTPELQEQEATETTETESATVTETPAEAPQDGFQKRINKVTADKYAEKRRADDLQRQLDELSTKPVDTQAKGAPKLEDFDFDQEKHNAALIKHEVAEGIAANQAKQDTDNRTARANQATKDYNGLVSELGKEDFHEVAGRIPALDQGLVGELMSTKEGVEMIYHLGEHLDLADKIASMSPLQAMAELGRISVNMSAQTPIKLSAAPDPIEPINSGGSLNKDVGEMSMAEIYNG